MLAHFLASLGGKIKAARNFVYIPRLGSANILKLDSTGLNDLEKHHTPD